MDRGAADGRGGGRLGGGAGARPAAMETSLVLVMMLNEKEERVAKRYPERWR